MANDGSVSKAALELVLNEMGLDADEVIRPDYKGYGSFGRGSLALVFEDAVQLVKLGQQHARLVEREEINEDEVPLRAMLGMAHTEGLADQTVIVFTGYSLDDD